MGTAKQGHAPLQIMAFWADTQIMPEIDSCTLPMFSGVATNQNDGMVESLRVVNMAATCFKAEDYVGHISRLTHSISMGVSQIHKIVPEALPQV